MEDQAPGVSNTGDPPSPHQETGSPLRDSKGWDGKLRVGKQAVLANPEALTDPDYSDEENIIQGETSQPDEGRFGPWLSKKGLSRSLRSIGRL